jgi:hypothetical protein
MSVAFTVKDSDGLNLLNASLGSLGSGLNIGIAKLVNLLITVSKGKALIMLG